MLEPRKRTALDGKTWWCVFDTYKQQYSTLICFGKYETKKDCQLDIDYYYIKDIERRLNDGIKRTQKERDKCIWWLIKYKKENNASIKELDDLCFENSTWVFDNIFG